MKRKIALILVVALISTIIFGAVPARVNAVDEQEINDQYNSNSMLAQYSAAEITGMYRDFAEYLVSQLRNFNTDIAVGDYNLHKNVIGAIFFSVVTETPDLFYVFSTRFQTTANYSTGKVISIRPEYYFDIEDIPAEIEKFNNKADLFLSGVDPNWNDVIKARYLHDLLAHYTEYDTKYETINDADYEEFRREMRIYTAYGAIVEHNAVCEGYALAYNYLLSKLGIRGHYIQSIKQRHAWNMVEIDGKFYHVDITHDDPTYDNLGKVNHDNFFKSDNWFNNDNNDDHREWITNLKASDTSFDNAWWNSVNTMIYRYNGYDYFVNQHYTSSVYAALSRRSAATGAEEVITVLKTRWEVKGVPNAFWDRAFTYLTSDGTYLYFNDTENVFRMAINGTTVEKIYTKPSSNPNDIYGIAFKMDGNLYTTIKESPNVKDVIYQLNIHVQPPTTPTEASESTEVTESTGFTEPVYTTDTTDFTNPTDFTEPTSTENITSEATEPYSENYTSATEPITAAPTQPEIVKPTIINKSIKTYIKRKTSLTLKPAGSYKFSSSNKTVATVSSKGIITAKKKGKAIITAQKSSVIFKIVLTVKNPKLNYTKKTIKKNKSFKLKVTGGSGKIVYTTSNKKIATIRGKGKIIGKKKGKATITVKVCGLKLKCRVTVK
ncbi:MAG: Ig-like domain-containing protein [Ruminococcus sp.]|nr:Ig-like domain-containing protein [Ruminococcus sp.]